MNNYSLKQVFHSHKAAEVFALVNDKYNLSREQAGWLGGYDANLFYGDKKAEDLPKDLPDALKFDGANSIDLVKDYIMARLLVANDLFNGWPKKYLLSVGVSEKEIAEKIAQQTKELEEELQAEYEIFPEEENTEGEAVSEPYQPLEVKDARLAVLTTVKDHLNEICSPKIDFDALILFHNALFDYILGQGQDDIKSIAEIVKVLDENRTMIGNNNLPVAGESVSATVANWLALFRSKIGAGNWTDTLAIPKFLASHEAGLLKSDEKIFLGRVLEFYRRLKGYPDTLASLQEPDIGFMPAVPEVAHSVIAKSPMATEAISTVGIASSVASLPPRNDKVVLPQLLKPITQNLKPAPMSDIKPKSEIASSVAPLLSRNDISVSDSLLNEDEEAELSSHKLSSPNSKFQIPNSEAALEKIVEDAAIKNGVKFRDVVMQKRFTTAAVMFLKGIRDEIEVREMILKDETSGGLGAPSVILEPVIKMLNSIKTQNSEFRTHNSNDEGLVVPKNFDIKNPLKQMLDAEATAAATILSSPHVIARSEGIPSLHSGQAPQSLGIATPAARNDKPVQTPSPPPPQAIPNSKFQILNSAPHTMSDVTKPHPLMGGVEEMQYLSLADFRSLGATSEQRVARLNDKFALIKKESLAKFVSAIKAYRASPLFQQYVTLGANSLGQSKTITQEIAGDTGVGNFLTVEEFDALADFHETLSY